MKRNTGLFFPVFMLSLLILSTPSGWARTMEGVTFPETASIKDKTCKLIGVGIRKKLIIKVYLGGLYLEKPTKSAPEIIAAEQVKRIVMHFLYKEVRADQLIESWIEGFEKNSSKAQVAALKSNINRFNGFFTESVKKGETIVLTYSPGEGTEVMVKNVKRGVIEGHDFMKALFSIWFGPNPPSKGLKEGMLGE